MLRNQWLEVWRTERRWLRLRLLCAALWAGELFWVQAFPFAAAPYIKHPLLVQLVRFHLDFILTLALAFLLRRRHLIPLLAAQAAALAIMAAYGLHFHRPLMPARALYGWHEAWALRGDFYTFLFQPEALLLLLAAFALKAAALVRSGGYVLASGVRWRSLVFALVLYATPVALLQMTHLHLTGNPNGGMERVVFAYGYTLPWVFDAVANRSLQSHALRARSVMLQRFDRISPAETPLAIPNHLVVLQLESVDGNAIEASVQSASIMPFLRDLKSRSLYFRIQAFHATGSCDMDYAATTFTAPYPDLVPYRLPGIQYTNSMPAFLKGYGFKTSCYHGNSALFYDRGRVMEQLGFDHIYFKEQLTEKRLPASTIGFRDAAMLNCALQQLLSEKRAYLFLITLDTHFPFNQLAAREQEVFPQPQNEEQRYLNSLRYLDNCLRDFIGGLPDGATIVMYGDHTTSMHATAFTSDTQHGKEYVGCLIYRKASDLSSFQQTRLQPMATDGSLNLLDVMSYLRHSIEVSRPRPVGLAREAAETPLKPRQTASH